MHKKHTNIFIVGWFGSGNLGDEAILISQLMSLCEKIREVNFYILSFNVHRTQRLTKQIKSVKEVIRIGSKSSFFKTDFFGIFYHLSKADLVIVGGGGLFQDLYNYYPIPFFTCITILAKIFKKAVFYNSLGIGPVRTLFGKILCKIAFHLADSISVRDDESRQLLVRLGIKKEIHVTADPVFLLESKETGRIKELNNLICKNGKGKLLVGVTVQELLFWEELQKKALAEVLDDLYEQRNAKIILIPFGYYSDKWFKNKSMESVDLLSLQKIASMMRCDPVIINQELSPQELMSLIGKLDLMMSMRLHGIIMGLAMQIPVIALTYQSEYKLKSMMKRIGQDENIFEVDNFSSQALLKRIDDIIYNGKQIKNNLSQKVFHMKNLSNQNVDLIEKLLSEKKQDALVEHCY